MTRILRFIQSSDPRGGGPIEGARRFAQTWNELGHTQDILTLEPHDAPILPDYPGDIFHLGQPYGRGPLARYRYSKKVVPWLRENASKYDAIIVSGIWRYQAVAARRALKNSNIPYFVFPHGMLDPWFNKDKPYKVPFKKLSWLLVEGPLLNSAKAVFFTSEEEMRQAKNIFKPYHVNGMVVNYGAPDLVGDKISQAQIFRKMVPELDGAPYLLYLSRIHPKKGCDLAIAAFASIASKRPDLWLVMAGPDKLGMIPKLRAQATALGIMDRVLFPGMLEGDAKMGAFREAEAFVLPSHQENFGIAVAEALAAGTPVLISDKVNIWREIEADGAGIVGPDTVSGTTAVFQSYAALSESERAEMRDRARKTFKSRFDVDNAARSLMAILQDRS
ncbi:glycosyltransferase [Novosphingobium sp. P6W]|uniref:glycosyltransferase n=1 Tax=Novosphingobium sp. P6W TaxID=1609758 RepID=UPI0009E3BF6C|nr:glycosyltransferase [Novosphingobium sp. P6W]AXB80653.1 glycosyltransferase [Novosphingobium sp. P6W]